MELLLVIFIIVIFFLVLKRRKKKTKNLENCDNENKLNNFEDPYLSSSSTNDYKNSHEIFNFKQPFFYALNDEDFLVKLKSDFLPMAKKLANIEDEEIQNAIVSLVDRDYFTTKTGLPKYLQMVPIKRFINEGIFVEPNLKNARELLNNLSYNELKDKCKKSGLKVARTKSENIDNIVNSDVEIDVDYSSYFKLNPIVREIYSEFDNYCIEKIIESFQNLSLKLLPVDKKLDTNELRDARETKNLKLQNYGFNSSILFKNNEPLFRIYDYTIRDYGGDCVDLLQNGLLIFNMQRFLGRSVVGLVILVNDNKDILLTKTLINPDSNGFKEVNDTNYIYFSMKNDSFCVLDIETLESKDIKNPDDKDIYSLLENF